MNYLTLVGGCYAGRFQIGIEGHYETTGVHVGRQATGQGGRWRRRPVHQTGRQADHVRRHRHRRRLVRAGHFPIDQHRETDISHRDLRKRKKLLCLFCML